MIGVLACGLLEHAEPFVIGLKNNNSASDGAHEIRAARRKVANEEGIQLGAHKSRSR
ncbi:MAG TPA: hypothetical protein VL157_00555 [Gemmatimonadaceae bacterium]|nr:hypothetical protein [Gemmatimonadaceae bacterium]